MKITKQTIYTLDAKEIKIAIRKHLIDKLGTEPNIIEENIEISADVDRDGNAHNFFVEATVTEESDL